MRQLHSFRDRCSDTKVLLWLVLILRPYEYDDAHGWIASITNGSSWLCFRCGVEMEFDSSDRKEMRISGTTLLNMPDINTRFSEAIMSYCAASRGRVGECR
jgi:hypothetical protein